MASKKTKIYINGNRKSAIMHAGNVNANLYLKYRNIEQVRNSAFSPISWLLVLAGIDLYIVILFYFFEIVYCTHFSFK